MGISNRNYNFINGIQPFCKRFWKFRLYIRCNIKWYRNIYGEFLDTCAIIAKNYDMSMFDLMFNTDLLKEVLTTGDFWIYSGIGIAIMLFVGFQNKKSNFSDKDNE